MPIVFIPVKIKIEEPESKDEPEKKETKELKKEEGCLFLLTMRF